MKIPSKNDKISTYGDKCSDSIIIGRICRNALFVTAMHTSRIAPKTHTKLVGEAQVCLLDAPSPTQPILRTRRGCGADCRLLSVIVSDPILFFTHIKRVPYGMGPNPVITYITTHTPQMPRHPTQQNTHTAIDSHIPNQTKGVNTRPRRPICPHAHVLEFVPTSRDTGNGLSATEMKHTGAGVGQPRGAWMISPD